MTDDSYPMGFSVCYLIPAESNTTSAYSHLYINTWFNFYLLDQISLYTYFCLSQVLDNYQVLSSVQNLALKCFLKSEIVDVRKGEMMSKCQKTVLLSGYLNLSNSGNTRLLFLDYPGLSLLDNGTLPKDNLKLRLMIVVHQPHIILLARLLLKFTYFENYL